MRSRRIAGGALKLALVVGTVLNLINQWDAIASGASIRVGSLVLNYLVPYCVASISAAQALAREADRD